mgnify:FL=1|jgi:hypothetical protein|tara:strand:- start:2548 stop:3675 length:1128 start_codon:yes stop_codon:yes gene_type:complete
MANSFFGTFKVLHDNDVQATRTNLHEALPITGTIISGTYADENIKNYSHGMFQSVFDYPYLSSSANHIFDLTLGIASGSILSSSATLQMTQKQQMYNEMALVLAGTDQTGSIRKFDADGRLNDGEKIKECYFMNISRLLTKDEFDKGSFEMTLGANPTGSMGSSPLKQIVVKDVSGSDSFKINSPAGEYNILYVTSSTGVDYSGTLVAPDVACGLIYYQAGIVVLTSSLFKVESSGGLLSNALVKDGGTAGRGLIMISGSSSEMDDVIVSSSISGSADAIRNRIQNISFNNTTELNSTIYFCRINSNDFNYSSNPTYISSSKMRVKTTQTDEPVSYITTVGLYSNNNELLAVAKLSEPLKKTPANDYTLRVRLDY